MCDLSKQVSSQGNEERFIHNIEAVLNEMKELILNLFKEIDIYKITDNAQEKTILAYLLKLSTYCKLIELKVEQKITLEDNIKLEKKVIDSIQGDCFGNKVHVLNELFSSEELKCDLINEIHSIRQPSNVSHLIKKDESQKALGLNQSFAKKSVLDKIDEQEVGKFQKLNSFIIPRHLEDMPKSNPNDFQDKSVLPLCSSEDGSIPASQIPKISDCFQNLQKFIVPFKRNFLIKKDSLLNFIENMSNVPHDLTQNIINPNLDHSSSNKKDFKYLLSLLGVYQKNFFYKDIDDTTLALVDQIKRNCDEKKCDILNPILSNEHSDLKWPIVPMSQYFCTNNIDLQSVIPELQFITSVFPSTLHVKLLWNFFERLLKENAQYEIKVKQMNTEKKQFEKELFQKQKQVFDAVSAKDEFRKRADFIISKERNEFHQQILTLLNERQSLRNELEELQRETSSMAKDLEHIKQQTLLNETTQEQKMTTLHKKIRIDALKYDNSLKNSSKSKKSFDLMKKSVAEQEESISYLESSFLELKFLMDTENEQKLQRLMELEICLNTRDAECSALSEDLKKYLAELDEKCQENDMLKSQLYDLQVSSENVKAILIAELNLLKGDSQILRKKLIKLTKEKDMLWKRTDHLTYLQKSQSSGRWMNDGEATHCLDCKHKFSFTLRKHHCRVCGKIFCHSCANNWLITAASRGQTRVCNDCYEQHKQLMKVVEDGSNVDTICIHVEDDEAIETSSVIEESYSLFASSMNGNLFSGTSDSTRDHELSSMSRTCSFTPQVANTERKTSTACNFDVITDEEIAKSLSTSSPYNPLLFGSLSPTNNNDSGMSLTMSRTIDEILSAGKEGINGEIWISAGMLTGIPVSCVSPPIELHWKFACDNKSLILSLFYEENESSMECLLSNTSSNSGHLVLHLPGLYILQLDNSYSRVNARKVQYTLWANSVSSS